MTTFTLPQIGDGRKLLTHSRMQCGKTCHKKEWFKYELGLRRIMHAKPLRMGKAVAFGIELWTKGGTPDDAINRATADYEVLPAWCVSPDDIDEWMVEREIVRRLLSGYFWRWANDPIESVSCEETFVLPIINPETGKPTVSFSAGGKWDGIVRLADGRLAVKETKTCGEDISPESDYWGRLSMDQQISLYMLSARAMGYDVQTVMYDVMRKPAIKPRKLTKAEAQLFASTGQWFGEQFEPALLERETPAMYGARFASDIGERPDFYFARREIPRLETDLDEYRLELWQQQLDVRNRQKTGRWYRNTAACLTMGKCEFFQLCTSRWDESMDTPGGFEFVDCVHPELIESTHDE